MHLFSRQTRLTGGRTREAMTWAATITEKVNQTTGLGVGLWSRSYSPGFGTLAWSMFIPDLATLEAAGDKLQVDDAYIDLTDQGAAFTDDALDDQLSVVVHGDPDPERPLEYVSVVRAVCAAGHAVSGMTVGIEIAQLAEQITGLPTMFVADSTGSYGGVGWLTGYEDIGKLEAAQTALAEAVNFAELLDTKANGCYVEDATLTQQLIYRRLV